MRKILIIDDEESIRVTFAAFLERAGHDTVCADSYESAMDAIYDQDFDLVFVDIILGDSSGVNVLKNIKTRGLNCPVVMITGDPNIVTAADALRLGAFDYLIKPIKKETLLRVASHALQHKALGDEMRQVEQARERDRLHLEAIFRSVSEAIITVDAGLKVIEANAAAEGFFGVTPRGEDWNLRFHGGDELRSACLSAVKKTLSNRKAVQEQRIEYSRDGANKVAVLNSAPLKDGSGVFRGCVLVLRDISRLAVLERELCDRHHYHNIIGRSSRIKAIFGLIENLKDTDTTALITGESGTGKELVAKALHYSSARSAKPFVAVNCSALTETLLESELFGHVKGAFTSAIRDKQGRFELASGGTIFLDEIGDISPRIQLKLLRVLEEREFERVGDTSTIKVNARVIAATNRNLREMVKRGDFREDLYYRLKVIELTLPALRERREDIPLLLNHFLQVFNKSLNRSIEGFAPEAEKALMNYGWPGNVRELQHAVEHACVLCHASLIAPGDLPPELNDGLCCRVDSDESDERATLEEILRVTGGNKAKAARLMGVSRQTMYRRLARLGLDSLCN